MATPNGKRQRVEGNFLVHLAVPGTDHLEDLPYVDSGTEVLCFDLSQEIRSIHDEEVSDRPAFVMGGNWGQASGLPINWANFLPKDEYTLTRTRNIISVEAYKVLERELSAQLATLGGVSGYKQAVLCLETLVLSVMASVKFPIQDGIWCEWVPFGLFSETLRRLLDIKDPPAYLKLILAHARKLYMDILYISIHDLYEDTENMVRGGNIDLALVFMTNEDNFTDIVREWAFMARKRSGRNASAHPFDTDKIERKLAIEFYRDTLKEEYSSEFRNLGYLSLLKLELCEAQDDKKRKEKETEDVEALLQHLGEIQLQIPDLEYPAEE